MKYYKVGEIRPSQIFFSFGVGANIDLFNLSVIVMGLGRWQLGQAEEIQESRLLTAIQKHRHYHQVKRLYAPPVLSAERSYNACNEENIQGIPVNVFPRWYRCSACHLIAPLDNNLFELKTDNFHPDKTRYLHKTCSKANSPTAIPLRFVVACEQGHLNDFPWMEFVHQEKFCSSSGSLYLYQYGVSDAVTEVEVYCSGCKARRRMSDAFGDKAELPACEGYHAHLNTHDTCQILDEKTQRNKPTPQKTMLLGASNSWFPILLSTFSVPLVDMSRLQQLVDDCWETLYKITSLEKITGFREFYPQADKFEDFSDEELWTAIETKRKQDNEDKPQEKHYDLKLPEWLAFSNANPQTNNEDFHLETIKVPNGYEQFFTKIVLAKRLREVCALVGFTRIESPGEFDETWKIPEEKRAPLAVNPPTWVPAIEVRGEGIFIEFNEDMLAKWCQLPEIIKRENDFFQAHKQWRRQRNIIPEAESFPGIRYVLLHSFAHAFMRQLTIECGYTAASIRERIYAREPNEEGGPMSGLLIYTAAADSEGTLGGLIYQAQPSILARHLEQILEEQLTLCSSDPLCADHHPIGENISLHGAACHTCLFSPETSCERGNKYLDRALLVETLSSELPPFFK